MGVGREWVPMIAALYVKRGGPYWDLPGVDPWDEERDARLYAGPHPVVAHPPCARWGRYWHGGPSAKERKIKGDDGGCFASAISAVRRWGGVLEHPEASAAWGMFGLNRPPRFGGWVVADWLGGWTCCIEQGHYGHRARKATWLYAVKTALPLLRWGPCRARVKIDAGYHTAAERAAAAKQERSTRDVGRLGKAERLETPLVFRDELIAMARSVARERQTA